MYEQTLTLTGLSSEQAIIYEILIKNGPMPAGTLSKKTPIKRGLVYKILKQLISLDLVERIEKKHGLANITIFAANHPIKLQTLIDQQGKKIKDAKTALTGIIPSLISDFNLISGKPGIIFFDSLSGLQKILAETINSGIEVIYCLAEHQTIFDTVNKIAPEYHQNRQKKKITLRLLASNNETTPTGQQNEFTKIKGIKDPLIPTDFIMLIYGKKIAYLNTSSQKENGVILEDANIAKIQKNIFNALWR